MKEPVVLFNRSKHKSFQFTMYHRIVCVKEEKCYCTDAPAMGADRRGEFVRGESSVFIPPRGYSKPLPQAILDVPQVKQALAELPIFLMITNKLKEVQVITPKGRK